MFRKLFRILARGSRSVDFNGLGDLASVMMAILKFTVAYGPNINVLIGSL